MRPPPLLPSLGALLAVLALARLQPIATSITFTDATEASGITFVHRSSPDKKYIVESMGGGVALLDFDRDGHLDIYFVASLTVETAQDPRRARSELWRNRGDGSFEDVTEKAGVGYPGWGMGVATGDVDNDGWEDIYVTCFGPNRLYRNNGDGTFSDVTGSAAVEDARWSTGAAFADYDNDGWLDLFVANYIELKLDALPEFGKGKHCTFQAVPVQCGPRGLPGAGDSLYRNNGDGTFTEVAVKAGVPDPAGRFGLGVAWSDFDDDGRVDLFVANDAGPNFLYRNDGDGTFTEVGLQAGVALSEDGKEQGSMGVAVGDYDQRGRQSILVTNFADEYNALYRHDKGLLFTDVSLASRTAGAGLPLVGWGGHFLDFDNDGWLDILVVNGHVYPQVDRPGLPPSYRQPRLLYRNNGNGTFTNVTASAGAALAERAVSRGSAVGDLDNDGDVDVVVNNLDGRPALLRNGGGNRQAFVSIDLEGRQSNRSAFGARVVVRAGGLVQHAERRSGGSYISQNDARLHFGLGEWKGDVSLEVRWPRGAVERFDKVPANAFLRITEGTGRVRE